MTGETALLATAMLLCPDPMTAAFGGVKFDLNPAEIEMSRQNTAGGSARATSPNATGGGVTGGGGGVKPLSPGAAPAAPSALKIEFKSLPFFGVMTQVNCEKLLSWVNHAALHVPLPVPIISTKPPQLIFIWGPPVGGFVIQCIMTRCSVTYTRFLPTGTPIRASVSMALTEHAPSFPGTNPTSGGVPGRGSHVLHAGENLQSLALKHYGSERAWRRIADTNGVDDPLRVGAGRALYLPGAEADSSGAGRPGAGR